MFSILVAAFQITIVISFILFIPVTLGYRIYTVLKHKKGLKESLLITLLPFSFGYYYFLKDEEQSKVYNYLIIIFLIISFIGIIFTIYQWIPPFLNP